MHLIPAKFDQTELNTGWQLTFRKLAPLIERDLSFTFSSSFSFYVLLSHIRDTRTTECYPLELILVAALFSICDQEVELLHFKKNKLNFTFYKNNFLTWEAIVDFMYIFAIHIAQKFIHEI